MFKLDSEVQLWMASERHLRRFDHCYDGNSTMIGRLKSKYSTILKPTIKYLY